MNPAYPTDLINAELAPAISIPAPATLPIYNEPVSKLSSPSITSADPKTSISFLAVILSATLLFIS